MSTAADTDETVDPDPRVQHITFKNLKRLTIRDDELYWDNKRLVTARRLELTTLQKMWAGLVAFAALLAAIGGTLEGWAALNQVACQERWMFGVCEPQGTTSIPIAPGLAITITR